VPGLWQSLSIGTYIRPMKHCHTPAGRRVAYRVEGAADHLPLVLLHGFCEDHAVWTPIQDMLKPGKLVLVDMPGFGQSERPVQPDMAAYAESLLAVLDTEAIRRCVLVGHSMGGYLALEFAAQWPERLAGLGLFHSHPFEDSEARKIGRQREIEALMAGKRDLYVAQLFPNLIGHFFLKNHAETLQSLVSNGKKQSPEGIADALQAMMNRRDHQTTLVKAPYPTLFLLGAQDTVVPLDQALKAAMLPNVADLQVLPNAAHMAMHECPEESAAILNSFWEFCGE